MMRACQEVIASYHGEPPLPAPSSDFCDILLLGTTSIRVGRQELPFPKRYRKALGLLGFLASERDKPHSRDYLAALFWPELDESAARSNLRQVLSNLNQTLGGADRPSPLQSCRHSIGFRSELVAGLDLATLEHPLPACDSCHADECRLLADLAVRLTPHILSGDFLPAYNLPGCDEFELWLAHKREQLRMQQLLLLQRLITCSQCSGADEQALDYAHLLMKIDPDNEMHLRQVMEMHAAAGHPGAALKLFESFSRRLRRELDVAPEAATLALRDKLLNGMAPRVSLMAPSPFPVIQKVSLVVVLRVQWFSLSQDPEEASQRLYDLDQMTRALLGKKMGAFHLNSAGKGAFFYFGWPNAIVDAAWLAWSAALRLSTWARACQDARVKIGIHCGRLFSSLDNTIPDLLGEITEETARVCHNAQYNQPLVSDKVQQLLAYRGRLHKLQDRRRQSDGTVQALYYQAEENQAATAPASPLQGRDPQLEKLTEIRQDTGPGMVAILAGAGMGKTALVAQWLARQPMQGDTLHRLCCQPDLQPAPLETLFHFLTSHPPSARVGAISSSGRHLYDYEQWISDLDAVNIRDDGQKHRLFSRLVPLLGPLRPSHATLYWLEDVHWCDTLTLEFFIHLARHARPAPFLLVTGHQLPTTMAWPGHCLNLPPLPLSAGQALLQRWLPETASAEHRQQCFHLSGGIPLVLKLLAEHQGTQQIPDALIALFSPDIDRQGRHRELALILAVAGTDTPHEELAALMPEKTTREEIAEAMAAMVESGLLHRVTGTRVRFAHPLIPRILEELNAPSRIRRIRQALMQAVC
ncbi:BTAD domain-containing putative transcriptional regulator [Zobellella denitrificans]|uniref:BTAD domain-containing putative transcriptional regulator n=1 Tax=Zobellella denitrificans TaxID=347534 RepID=UPI000BBEB715|nr:BTAD domain-containing putative transcriptional regulator [Zobellella denitrificans]